LQLNTTAGGQIHLFTEVTLNYSIERILMAYLIGIVCFAAWLNHIFTCFSQEMWGFLIAGALFFPIGILHGFYLWFT